MANFDSVYSSNKTSFDEISGVALDAIASLKAAGSYLSIQNPTKPEYSTQQTIEFDPGAPTKIEIDGGPVPLSDILNNIDNSIAKISTVKSPVFPDAPTVKMEDHEIWQNALYTQIEDNLGAYITTMGIPDISYQNAIFNEEFERNKLVLEDLYSLADAKTGARGFTYTNAYGNSLKLEAQTKYQFDRTQVSRSISKTITEWARQNYQFAIEKGISHQIAHMDFTYKYCTASVEIYKNLVMALLEGYKAEIQVVLAPVDAYIKELQAVLGYTQISADIDKTNESLKQSRSQVEISEANSRFSSEISTYGVLVNKLIQEFSQKIEGYKYAAQQSAAMAQAASSTIIGIPKA